MDTGKIFNLNTYGAKAEEDLFNAHAVITGQCGTPRAGIFWCEQAIEKYFKHIIAMKRDDASELVRQHKLLPLAKEAGYVSSDRERVLLRELGSMYYECYPQAGDESIPVEPEWEDTNEALNLAKKVREWTVQLSRKRESKLRDGVKKLNLFLI